MTVEEFLLMFDDISEVDLVISNGYFAYGSANTMCVAGGSVQFFNGKFTSMSHDEVYSVEEILEEDPEDRRWMILDNRNVWTRQLLVSRLNTLLLKMEILDGSVKFNKHEFTIGVSRDDFKKLYGAVGEMYVD